MEADLFQSVLGKNDFEMRTDILWRKNIPDSVHADVVEIFFIVRTPKQFSHTFLLRFLFQKRERRRFTAIEFLRMERLANR